MTPELFRRVGEALYGPEWRMPLSRDLGVAYLTVRRWQSGAAPIPAGVVDELQGLVVAADEEATERSRALAELVQEIELAALQLREGREERE